MLDNVGQLKDEYVMKGGEDREFLKKVNDLENLLLYKKRPAPEMQ